MSVSEFQNPQQYSDFDKQRHIVDTAVRSNSISARFQWRHEGDNEHARRAGRYL